eukprot:6189058-Pleurochrysis_carterae.AAC.2
MLQSRSSSSCTWAPLTRDFLPLLFGAAYANKLFGAVGTHAQNLSTDPVFKACMTEAARVLSLQAVDASARHVIAAAGGISRLVHLKTTMRLHLHLAPS